MESSSHAASNCHDALETFRIPSLLPSFYYIPAFLTTEEQSLITQKIPPNRWTHLSHRRLQTHPSPLTATSTLLAAPLPSWLTTTASVASRFEELGVFNNSPHRAPNHVLINEYKPGEGIMPHEDGSAYAPVVATITLDAYGVLDIYSKGVARSENAREDKSPSSRIQITRIFQEPGSLLVTIGSSYRDLLHGISAVNFDETLGPSTVANWEMLSEETRRTIEEGVGRLERGTRISLTYRDVIKVSEIGRKILGLGSK
ncbi:hypothetical protein M501DRAFT_1006317 [Patellaria atrata CBS 101060]|uniref:Fe2OG dioxygenase domain-containing protein n=1 Tax=Patellaria atrata CBS 101060 TaxID=1346257 RepID=A0A9P4VQF2_9PEZI|nr:hypothetical protein M501DRAFT_1006317 [Patellaria atrata CBS 101060]